MLAKTLPFIKVVKPNAPTNSPHRRASAPRAASPAPASNPSEEHERITALIELRRIYFRTLKTTAGCETTAPMKTVVAAEEAARVQTEIAALETEKAALSKKLAA